MLGESKFYEIVPGALRDIVEELARLNTNMEKLLYELTKED